jgi:hypothetical protein
MRTLLILALSALVSGVVELWPFLQERPVLRGQMNVDSQADRSSRPCVQRRECRLRTRRQGPAESHQPVVEATASPAGGPDDARDPHRTDGLWLHATTAVEL